VSWSFSVPAPPARPPGALSPPAVPPRACPDVDGCVCAPRNSAVLKKALYECFAQFGPVLDVVCMKTIKMRGQAFVVFKDVTAATNAIKGMQGFPFFGSEMQITFARGKSDCVAKLDGTYLPRDAAEKQRKRKLDEERREKKKLEREAEKAAAKAAAAAEAAGPEAAAGDAEAAPMEEVEEAPTDPNKILFVQGLPAAFPKMALQMLFQQYPGLAEVRDVPGKDGIAFVEFADEMQATVAMNGLQGFKVTSDDHIRITYAKK
jgi:RNA recognition motif-containing protein